MRTAFALASTSFLALSLSGCPSTTVIDDASTAPDMGAVAIDTGTVAIDTGAIDTGSVALPDAGAAQCEAHSDCAIRAASCCGRCGAATDTDFLAAPVSALAAIAAAICEAEGNPGCPECAAPDDPELVALCREGRCVGVDLGTEPITECSAPSDCVLAARECCACGLIEAPAAIAYNPARGTPNTYVCDDGTACPPCVPTFASGVTAGCVAGRCVVFGPD